MSCLSYTGKQRCGTVCWFGC